MTDYPEEGEATPLRLRTFSSHYRSKYRTAVGKIPLDLGLSCPNREHGGCIFCNPEGFKPAYLAAGGGVGEQIERGRKQLLKGRFASFFAYFQQETPTALETEELLTIFAAVLGLEDCLGLIISTRPDFLPLELLEKTALLVERRGKECLVELGLQSVHERSLRRLNRNHGFGDFLRAHERLRRFEVFEVGVHLLFGIPGESPADMRESLLRVTGLGIDALKLHQLQVLRGTALERLHAAGDCPVFSRRQYLELLLSLLPLVPENVVIHRLWATSHPRLLVAPCWNVKATVLSGELLRLMRLRGIRQGMHCRSARQVPPASPAWPSP